MSLGETLNSNQNCPICQKNWFAIAKAVELKNMITGMDGRMLSRYALNVKNLQLITKLEIEKLLKDM